jgi:hypothetical protein
MDAERQAYVTMDLMEAAHLAAHRLTLIETERDPETNRVRFSFENREACEDHVGQMLKKIDITRTIDLMDAVRHLRGLIRRT